MFGTGELLIIFLVVLLLFGGKKLPELARSLGMAMREFKKANQGWNDEEEVKPKLKEQPSSEKTIDIEPLPEKNEK